MGAQRLSAAVEQAIALLKQGLTYREAAIVAGVAVSSITRAMRKLKIHIPRGVRPRSDPLRAKFWEQMK